MKDSKYWFILSGKILIIRSIGFRQRWFDDSEEQKLIFEPILTFELVPG